MKAAEVFIAVILSVCIIIGCAVLLFSTDKISALNTQYKDVNRIIVTGIGEIRPVTCYTVSSIGFVSADKEAIGEELAGKFEKYDWATYQYYFDNTGRKAAKLKDVNTASSQTYPVALDSTYQTCTIRFSALETVKTYPITVEVKKDAYTITYYTIPSVSLAHDITAFEAEKIEKHIITVPKDSVTLIEHSVGNIN